MIVFLNGRFIGEDKATISAFDHGFYFGDGVYETMRTVEGRLWQGEKHIKRLFFSAACIDLKIPWTKKQTLGWIKATVKRNGFRESRIRLTVSRGNLDLTFSKKNKATILIRIEPLKEESKEVYEKGVKVATMPMERFLPQAKTLNLLPQILAFQKMQKEKVYEVLFVNRKGYVTEGAITNYFVIKKSALITPKDEILLGTTRDHIIEIAKKEKFSVQFENFKLEEILGADECFICNAPRGIIPVREIDGIRMPNNGFKMAKFFRERLYRSSCD